MFYFVLKKIGYCFDLKKKNKKNHMVELCMNLHIYVKIEYTFFFWNSFAEETIALN